MPDSGSAQLAGLLSRLSEQVQREGIDVEASDPPTSSEAMALYFVAARLAELQLQIAERDGATEDDQDLDVTRAVLEGTRGVLRAALARAEQEPPPAAPKLSVLEGGRLPGQARTGRATQQPRQKKNR